MVRKITLEFLKTEAAWVCCSASLTAVAFAKAGVSFAGLSLAQAFAPLML